MKDKIIPLCLLYRGGKIDLLEFANRVQVMVDDPGQAMDITIDVEKMVDQLREAGVVDHRRP